MIPHILISYDVFFCAGQIQILNTICPQITNYAPAVLEI